MDLVSQIFRWENISLTEIPRNETKMKGMHFLIADQYRANIYFWTHNTARFS